MREVLFFIMDMGCDIVIEVLDIGFGVLFDKMEVVFERGYFLKGRKRGYGLVNVKDLVCELGGWIELVNLKIGGVVFIVFILKKK